METCSRRVIVGQKWPIITEASLEIILGLGLQVLKQEWKCLHQDIKRLEPTPRPTATIADIFGGNSYYQHFLKSKTTEMATSFKKLLLELVKTTPMTTSKNMKIILAISSIKGGDNRNVVMAKGGNIRSEIALIPARPKWPKFGRKKYEAMGHEAF
jgi:hypothetical protein